jgi:hypothetical protein
MPWMDSRVRSVSRCTWDKSAAASGGNSPIPMGSPKRSVQASATAAASAAGSPGPGSPWRWREHGRHLSADVPWKADQMVRTDTCLLGQNAAPMLETYAYDRTLHLDVGHVI